MDAELSRLLSRAVQSPNYRREGDLFAQVQGITLGDKSLADWLIEQAIAAYSTEKLSPEIQGFLKDCDRSWQIEQEMFSGPVEGTTQEERDAKVLEKLAEEQTAA